MLRRMDAVVALHPGRSTDAVCAVLARADVSAKLLCMFPGATDADGRRWHLLQCADAARLPALVAQLQQHADVDAAYIKPAGAAP